MVRFTLADSTTIDGVITSRALTPARRMQLLIILLSDSRKTPSVVPVYDKSKEYIIGYVLKDVVLKQLSDDKFATKLSDIMRPILSFNEDDSVYQIWEKMLEKREHISIIVDEYGCLRGVVSMEDVIETMTGVEIVDEDDVAVDMQAFAKEKSRRMLKK